MVSKNSQSHIYTNIFNAFSNNLSSIAPFFLAENEMHDYQNLNKAMEKKIDKAVKTTLDQRNMARMKAASPYYQSDEQLTKIRGSPLRQANQVVGH